MFDGIFFPANGATLLGLPSVIFRVCSHRLGCPPTSIASKLLDRGVVNEAKDELQDSDKTPDTDPQKATAAALFQPGENFAL